MSNENRVSEVRTSQKEPERERRIFTFKATQLVWLLFGILIALIALRIGLMLIGANPASAHKMSKSKGARRGIAKQKNYWLCVLIITRF